MPLPGGEGYTKLKALARDLNLHTVCEEARCPNVGECWSGTKPTMTLMVLGDECTRRCRFCAVKTVDRAAALRTPTKPRKVGRGRRRAEYVGYVVITSVDRDDLPDGGAGHYAELRANRFDASTRGDGDAARWSRRLIPDYTGRVAPDAWSTSASRRAWLTTSKSSIALQRRIRDPRCSFERSLETLRQAKALDPSVFTKSSLMVGLGESAEEILDAMRRLRGVGVDFLTIGQYLRPTPNHAPVREWITPEQFAEFQVAGEALGFRYVASNPLVRSSYRAGEFFFERMVRGQRDAARVTSTDERRA